MDESTTTELDGGVEAGADTGLDAGPRRRTVVGESVGWFLVVWALAPAAWLCADWLFRVPPVRDVDLVLILAFVPWAVVGGFLAILNTAFTDDPRTTLLWTVGGCVGVAATLAVLHVPSRWTLPTAVRSDWARNADAALESADDWFAIPGAESPNGASFYVRASSVVGNGVGVLVDEYDDVVEVEPRYQEHDDRRWTTYPADEGWWFVFRLE